MDFDPLHKWLGIPPSEQPPHHYRLLGIDLFESDSDVIESGAQRQMTHVRSYALGPNKDASQALLNQLAAARVVLLNPNTKKQYDHSLRQTALLNAPSVKEQLGKNLDSTKAPFAAANQDRNVSVVVPSSFANAIPCPSCNGLLQITPDYYGKDLRCSYCEQGLVSSQDGRELQTKSIAAIKTAPENTSMNGMRTTIRSGSGLRTRASKRSRSEYPYLVVVVSVAMLIPLCVFAYCSFSGLSLTELLSGRPDNLRQKSSSGENIARESRTRSAMQGKTDVWRRRSSGQAELEEKQKKHNLRGLGGGVHSSVSAPHFSTSNEENPGAARSDMNSSSKNSIGDSDFTASSTKDLEMEFVAIPAGEFIMGTGFESHRVTLSRGFEMSICEVTQAQFEIVMNENPSRFKGLDHPVEKVSWEQAVEFCRRLSASPEAVESGYQYRLPYEAEWEYACNGSKSAGTQIRDVTPALEVVAWFRENSRNATHPVGMKEPNLWGLYDMRGNVSEWCMDWKGAEKPVVNEVDPRGPDAGVARINRGGSWLTDADRVQKAARSWGSPRLKEADIGFRVVRTLSGNSTGSATTEINTSESETRVHTKTSAALNHSAQQKLVAVRELIKTAKWKEMKRQAETLMSLKMNQVQRENAEALSEIAELATYYLAGIAKGIQAQNSGNDFEVVDGFRVLVVEKGPDSITILYNRKNKKYSLDELPLSLAHKLATFAIPGSSRQLAAKAVYHSISPQANAESRKEALTWLDELAQSSGEEDPKRIAECLKEMFSTTGE